MNCGSRFPVNEVCRAFIYALPVLSHSLPVEIQLVLRVSQLAAELLVVSITWRHTYHWQLYNVRKDSGIKYGASIGSFLVYNGELSR